MFERETIALLSDLAKENEAFFCEFLESWAIERFENAFIG